MGRFNIFSIRSYNSYNSSCSSPTLNPIHSKPQGSYIGGNGGVKKSCAPQRGDSLIEVEKHCVYYCTRRDNIYDEIDSSCRRPTDQTFCRREKKRLAAAREHRAETCVYTCSRYYTYLIGVLTVSLSLCVSPTTCRIQVYKLYRRALAPTRN